MEWPKLKNIILLILLLANLFLVSMVVVQERTAARYQAQALDNAVSVLESNGIRVERERIPADMELTVLTVSRDLESEKALARALLGECAMTDLGGGRYAYESAVGAAEFRGNGNFTVSFPEGKLRLARSGGEAEYGEALLKDAGLSAVLIGRAEEEGRTVLTFRQTWQGAPIYSFAITMEYENGSLRTLSGTRMMGTPQSANEKSELISVPTALLRFLNGVNDLGDICNEITAMESGYLTTSGMDATRLIPVWYVTTDTGVYSLNALTGALERT